MVMPEHFHILIGEPYRGDPSKVLQVLKQRVALRLLAPRSKRRQNQLGLWREEQSNCERHFWKIRFYDFNVYSRKKIIEKLRYMHRNPVKRGLVSSPELWRWSSFRAYALGEKSVVNIERLNPNPTLKRCEPQKFGSS